MTVCTTRSVIDLTKVEVDFHADVMGVYAPWSPLPDHIRDLTGPNLDNWVWYCDWCLEKRTWRHFRINKNGWPSAPCSTCYKRILAQKRATNPKFVQRRQHHHAKHKQRCIAHTDGRRKLMGGKALKKPSAVETFCQIAMDAFGGPTGFAEYIYRTVKCPDLYPNAKIDLIESINKALEAKELIEHERRQLEMAEQTTYNRSLNTIPEDELRAVLKPLLLELLKNRPEVGIQAMKSEGYVVGRTAAQLIPQLQKLPKSQQEKILWALAGDPRSLQSQPGSETTGTEGQGVCRLPA